MIEGVEKGYSKELDVNGVGYRVEKKGNQLVMRLGFSHEQKAECTLITRSSTAHGEHSSVQVNSLLTQMW